MPFDTIASGYLTIWAISIVFHNVTDDLFWSNEAGELDEAHESSSLRSSSKRPSSAHESKAGAMNENEVRHDSRLHMV